MTKPGRTDFNAALERVEEITNLFLKGERAQVVAVLGEPLSVKSFSRADVMRGVATQVIPQNVEWDIVEYVGGGCRLIITQTELIPEA